MAEHVLFLGADANYLYDFRKNLISGLIGRDYKVTAVATCIGDFDSSKFRQIGADYTHWNISKTGLNPLRDLRAIIELIRIVRDKRPNIIFMHTAKPVIYGSIVSKLAGVPRRVALIPGLGHAFMPTKTLRHLFTRLVAIAGYRIALSQVSAVIFQNPDDLADMRELGALPPQLSAYRVFGSGVDTQQFSEAPLPAGPPHFLMLSRLLGDKGVREFVEAAKIVRANFPEVRFSLVGPLDSNPSAVTNDDLDCWRAEGVVEIHGHTTDARHWLALCSVFVLPSYYREGTPRATLEAMSVGRAIITTDVPGCRETVKQGINGLLVPPRNVEALAAAMIELARDSERVAAMGKASRILCENLYELDKITQHMLAIIEGAPITQINEDVCNQEKLRRADPHERHPASAYDD